MAPKKRQKTEEPRATVVPADTVSDVMLRAADNVQAIKGHKAFKDIMQAQPLSITDGGRCEAYSDDTFKAVFSKGGDLENKYYTCGFNFMWINHTKRAMVGVPISSRSVADLVKTTRLMSGDIGVLDIALDSAEDLPSKFRGAIERLTPPEESYALLELIRRDVDADNTERLAVWKKKLLTVQVNIRMMPDASDRWWFEYNIRDEIGERFQALYQTTYQKVCAIIRIAAGIAEKEGAAQATAARIFGAMRNGANTLDAPKIPGAEAMSEAFIKQCLIVRDGLFSNSRCKEIIAELDELHGHDSVLNSVYKLAHIKTTAQSKGGPPVIEWVLEAIRDGVLRKSPFFEGRTVVRDYQQTNAGKNIVSTIMAKKDFLDFALQQASQMFPHEVVVKLREVFSSYEEYRKFKPIDGAEAKTTWMAQWPVPARIFLEFISDAVFLFNVPYVHGFQTFSRRTLAISTLVEQNVAISDEWTRIKRGVEDDAKAAKVKAELEAKEAATKDNGAGEDGDAQRAVKDEGDAKNDAADDDGSCTRENNPKAYWMRFAQETVRSRVFLVPMPETSEEMKEILKTSDIANLSFTPGLNTVLKVWDEKLASEALSMPWIRKGPHRPTVFKRAIAGSLSANPGQPGLAKGEMVLVYDHGKKNMLKNAKTAFDGVPHHTQTYELQYDEESMTTRRRRAKSRRALINQTEKLMVFVNDKKWIPEAKRKHYAGTNRGQQWGFIAMPPYNAVWRVKAEDKKEALGDALRPVGGKAEEDGSDEEMCSEDEAAETNDDNLVPFAYHGLPKTFFESMVHAFKAKGIVDFTPGDGTLAEVALDTPEVLYMGFCHTERHCSMLRARLGEQVMAAMQNEDSPLFSAFCVSDLKKTTATPKPKAKPKEKPKKKKKVKKGKKRKRESDSEDDESSKSSASSSSPPGGDD